jgi:uncharacterized protein (DUF433 family)
MILLEEPGMSAQTTYKWLEPKPAKRSTRQLGIRGRNMTVWNLVADVVAGGKSPDEVARDYRLPPDAVEEALAYYRANCHWIDEEIEGVGRRFEP